MKSTYLLKVNTDGTTERIPFDPSNSYEQLSGAVEGFIELVPVKLPYDCDLFVNEEGKLNGLPLNEKLTRLYALENGYLDLIVGNGIFARHDDAGETLGLTEEVCDYLENYLKR